jgi:hypothetical protein
LDDLSVDDPMKEVHEFMLISGEREDGTEGQPDSAAEVAPIAVVEYEARRVVLKTTTVKTLKAIAAMFKLSAHGKRNCYSIAFAIHQG